MGGGRIYTNSASWSRPADRTYRPFYSTSGRIIVNCTNSASFRPLSRSRRDRATCLPQRPPSYLRNPLSRPFNAGEIMIGDRVCQEDDSLNPSLLEHLQPEAALFLHQFQGHRLASRVIVEVTPEQNRLAVSEFFQFLEVLFEIRQFVRVPRPIVDLVATNRDAVSQAGRVDAGRAQRADRGVFR